MNESVRILIAQINPTVGNIHDNAAQIISIIQTHAAAHDIILFPEMVLSGYPPEDLLYKDAFHQQIEFQLTHIQQATPDCYVILGYPERHSEGLFNAASVFYQGKKLAHYHKQHLPNYGVFDEVRYFTPGEKRPCIISVKNMRFGICICEDLWRPGPLEQLERADIDYVLTLNASPFDNQKYEQRLKVLENVTQKGMGVVYANLVGGQDELLFDGQSISLDKKGQLQARGHAFEPELLSVSLLNQSNSIAKTLSSEALQYKALVTATRDYLHKNHFSGALIGLSGGIDSALTLAIAVDALGAENVTAVKMPSRYTQAMSLEDADFQIQALQVKHHTLSIEAAYEAFLNTLRPVFGEKKADITEENIQARIRGTLLMALSNRTDHLVLTTTNKSELAMGYGTLYGDMAGSYAVLKDVYKHQVYELARYRNQLSSIIPERIFTRPPSAELAPNQTDQDTLPPYDILDALIEAYVERNQTIHQLLEQGFSAKDINFVIQRIRQQEYKRQQAPLGPKLTRCAFGKDWRFPNTQH